MKQFNILRINKAVFTKGNLRKFVSKTIITRGKCTLLMDKNCFECLLPNKIAG